MHILTIRDCLGSVWAPLGAIGGVPNTIFSLKKNSPSWNPASQKIYIYFLAANRAENTGKTRFRGITKLRFFTIFFFGGGQILRYHASQIGLKRVNSQAKK